MTLEALLAAVTACANAADTFGRIALVRLEKMRPDQVQAEVDRQLQGTQPFVDGWNHLFDMFKNLQTQKDKPNG